MAKKIELVRGSSKVIVIEVTDETGTPYTLEDGDRLLFGVKRNVEEDEYVIFKDITQTEDGIYRVALKPADTIALEYGRYVYDVGLEKGEDYYPVIDASAFVISPNVTKWGDRLD